MDKVYNTNEPFLNMEIGMKIFKNQTTIGEGVIDFKNILKSISDSSVEYLIVESDFPENPMEFAEKSIINLKKML